MKSEEILHEKLVNCAAQWLAKKHPIVITELAHGGGEEADAIGFKNGFSTLVECKISRSDFLADAKKMWRQIPHHGLGDFRYYCCPKGLVSVQELPEAWGLLEVSNGKVRLTHEPPQHPSKRDHRGEVSILISVLRRIGQNPPQGVSIRCYTIETGRRATCGIEPEEKIEADNTELVESSQNAT